MSEQIWIALIVTAIPPTITALGNLVLQWQTRRKVEELHEVIVKGITHDNGGDSQE